MGLNGQLVPVQQGDKGFGYWWSHDFSATKAIEEIIADSEMFFARGGLGSFQGKLLSAGLVHLYKSIWIGSAWAHMFLWKAQWFSPGA